METTKRRKWKEFLGISSDVVTVGQFISGVLGSLLGKILLSAAVVGGASYVGVKAVEQINTPTRTPISTALAMASPPTTQARLATDKKEEQQKSWQSLYSLLQDYWRKGDLVGVLSVTNIKTDAANAQEIEKYYHRFLINWRLFDDLSLVPSLAQIENRSGGEMLASVPTTFQGNQDEKIQFYYKDNQWLINDFFGFLERLKATRTVSENISYIQDGDQRKSGSMHYNSAQGIGFADYSMSLTIDNGCPGWFGDVTYQGQVIPGSSLSGNTITLNEMAVAQLNEQKVAEIVVNLKTDAYHAACPLTSGTSFTLKLY